MSPEAIPGGSGRALALLPRSRRASGVTLYRSYRPVGADRLVRPGAAARAVGTLAAAKAAAGEAGVDRVDARKRGWNSARDEGEERHRQARADESQPIPVVLSHQHSKKKPLKNTRCCTRSQLAEKEPFFVAGTQRGQGTGTSTRGFVASRLVRRGRARRRKKRPKEA